MIVQIDIGRFTAAAIPSKDQPPLPVDAYRVEAYRRKVMRSGKP